MWPAFRAEADCRALHCAAATGSINDVASLLRRGAFSDSLAEYVVWAMLHHTKKAERCAANKAREPRARGGPPRDARLVRGEREGGDAPLARACCGGGWAVAAARTLVSGTSGHLHVHRNEKTFATFF